MSPFWLAAALLTAGNAEAVDFDTQIVPVLTRYGCNSGACHGSAAGRGGFNLSLYGSNPGRDFEAIVFDLEGRRVAPSRPDESLLFLKATESLNHGGGPRFDVDSEAAQLLLRWIRNGARRDSRRNLSDLVLEPATGVLPSPGDSTAIRVLATFSNGSTEDVTRWSTLTPDDADAVTVASDGTATVHRRGRHLVQVRYLHQVRPIELIVPVNDEPFDLSTAKVVNFVDEHVLQRLRMLHLPASSACDDAAFLRRTRLRLTGRLPTPEEVRGFLQERGSGRAGEDHRRQLVDRLLESDNFSEYWTHWLATLLRIRTQPQDDVAARTYHTWIRQQLDRRTPFDQLAVSLLTATGDSHEVGPASFYRTSRDPRTQAEFTSELFMGVQLRCANCHDHPLDRWTQDDYHGLAAVFARLDAGRVITVRSRGEVIHPRTGEAAVARIPAERFLDEPEDPRVDFAEWLTRKDNAYFDRAVVNRLWKVAMGRGLVEPADDLRATNPGTHPLLLKKLADDFADHGRDLRHTLRLICSSDTFARSSVAVTGNESDDRFYSRFVVRPLPAEVLADAISDVTGVAAPYGEEPTGTRAINLFAGNVPSRSLDILGRCPREESCESTTPGAGDLPRALHLINGPLLNQRLASPTGRVHELVAKLSDSGIVEEFYLSSLSRFPTDRERQYWQRQFANAGTDQKRLSLAEDVVWSLLMSQEFVTSR